MRVTYVGSYADGVEVPAAGALVERNGSLEVADALGLSLCDQPENWQPADKAAEKTLAALRAERDAARAAAGGDPAESTAPAGADDPTVAVEKGELP